MINGTHLILYSSDAAADRAFFRDVLEMKNVDVGGGWLIFALPPAEMGIHPSDKDNVHEIYFTTDDLEATKAALQSKGASFGDDVHEDWGTLIAVSLPGGGEIGIYEPKHPSPQA